MISRTDKRKNVTHEMIPHKRLWQPTRNPLVGNFCILYEVHLVSVPVGELISLSVRVDYFQKVGYNNKSKDE